MGFQHSREKTAVLYIEMPPYGRLLSCDLRQHTHIQTMHYNRIFGKLGQAGQAV